VQSLVCSLVLALLALWPAPIVSAAQEISIRPGSGREMDTFMVRGYGLPAGVAVDVRLFSPEERVYRLTGVGGLIVGPDGEFSVSVVPVKQLVGSTTGAWSVEVCGEDADTCLAGDFEITP